MFYECNTLPIHKNISKYLYSILNSKFEFLEIFMVYCPKSVSRVFQVSFNVLAIPTYRRFHWKHVETAGNCILEDWRLLKRPTLAPSRGLWQWMLKHQQNAQNCHRWHRSQLEPEGVKWELPHGEAQRRGRAFGSGNVALNAKMDWKSLSRFVLKVITRLTKTLPNCVKSYSFVLRNATQQRSCRLLKLHSSIC